MTKPVQHQVNLAYLTGSKKKVEYSLFNRESDIERPSRNTFDMFFAPYESKQEFVYCASNTLFAALWLWDPFVIFDSLSQLAITNTIFFILGQMGECAGSDEFAFFFNDFAHIQAQNIVNILVLPVSSLILLTRSISSVLELTGLTNQAEMDNSSAALTA